MVTVDFDREVEDSWREGLQLLRNEIQPGDWDYQYGSALYRISNSRRAQDLVHDSFAKGFGISGSPPMLALDRDYEPGWVYLLHADNHCFKIGKTTKIVTERVTQIGLIVPMEIRLVACTFTDAVSLYERALHQRLPHRRVRGEWFRLTFWEFAYIASQDNIVHFRPDTSTALTDAMSAICANYEFGTLARCGK